MAKEEYYIGLDCGTSSVGWAVTDPEYHILRKRGKSLWGARLFDEAKTAADRRIARSTRRRTARAAGRLKLLRMLFSDEISKVDPDFYIRLRESFYLEEDKNFTNPKANSTNTLFNDPIFKDKDFHKKYPTIWHLRRAIIEAPESEHFDIRLYFLAIQHILKNRGHFLREGDFNDNVNDFTSIWLDFVDKAANIGFCIEESTQESVEKIIKDRKTSKLDRKKELKDLMFIENEEDDSKLDKTLLSGLIIGSSVDLVKMMGYEGEKCNFSFDNNVLEDKIPEIEQAIGIEGLELVEAAKQIFDYSILDNLMSGESSISNAMVKNYNLHQAHLAELKTLLKPYHEDYNTFFKTEEITNKTIRYNQYIGKAYTKDKSGRKKTSSCSQEDINKEIKRLLEKHNIETALLKLAENNELLPKQRGQAKGTIPQQLHHRELVRILDKLQQDYPSFAEVTSDEEENINTKAKKIATIHSFRIPYYCGPLVKKQKDDEQSRDSSAFSWADEEIKEIVYPWNFEKLVNLESRANNFIRRMTNECTYLLGEEVLPKSSLAYQKYMVLNQLNSLRFSGHPIDVETKDKIYERIFINNEITGNITLKRLKTFLVENNLCPEDADLSENKDLKILPRLKTHQDFVAILGEDYQKHYPNSKLENVIEYITILGNEKSMLAKKILQELNCSKEEAEKLSRKNYSDWGNFSMKFLCGIRSNIDGKELTILEALEQTTNTLMELLSSKYSFKEAIEEHNSAKQPQSTELTYEDVKNLYCSPAVKRSVWQTIRIVKELEKVLDSDPSKIFIEVTRSNEEKPSIKLSRKKELEAKLKVIKSESARQILEQLNSREDRELQQKKLFLYFSQMGKCAYSGEPINIESLMTDAYDIDHIYPRSLTKDDSITRNLVLVKKEYNLEKSNNYPLKPEWQNKMFNTWRFWYASKLITLEKYNRLMRKTALTDDELGGFVARQIVETSQTTKAIRDLLQRAYPDTKVILVKASQVSDFRHTFGKSRVDENGNYIAPQFIKVRALNDFHHAKDAYLNIIVGNVLNSTFTDSPVNFIKNRPARNYSLRTDLLFRSTEEYKNRYGTVVNWPQMKGWNYKESFDIISETMKRNDVLWTKMPYQASGAISDLMIVGKSEKTDGIMPIKNSKRLSRTEKYGGYRSVASAYFALIEQNQKRYIVQVPIATKDKLDKYLLNTYADAKIIIPKLNIKSYLKINGFPVHLAGKTNTSLALHLAFQLELSYKDAAYLSDVIKTNQKITSDKKYKIDAKYDKVSKEQNSKLLDSLFFKLNYYRNCPMIGSKIEEIQSHRSDFDNLPLESQLKNITNLISVMSCNASIGDISDFVPKASQFGKCFASNNLSNLNSAYLILQSPTGLYERKIDLKTTPPINLGSEL